MVSRGRESAGLAIVVLAASLLAAAPVTAGGGRASAEPQAGLLIKLRYAPPGEPTLVFGAEAGPDLLVIDTDPAFPDDIVFEGLGGTRLAPRGRCIAQSETVVRCPLQGLRGAVIELGEGDDDVRAPVGFGDGLGRRVNWLFRLGAGDDRLIGGPADEDMSGGPGDDFGRTGGGRDRLIGGTGNDRLFGGSGVDFFSGGQGNDFARGGGGDDRGAGGPGKDDFKD